VYPDGQAFLGHKSLATTAWSAFSSTLSMDGFPSHDPGPKRKTLAGYLSQQNRRSRNSDLTTALLEVLACIAFKQSMSQAEIDRLFDVDKRGSW
jgi:hypothetical protein